MRVLLRYYGFFSTLTGRLMEEVDLPAGCTVQELLDRLQERYGYKFIRLCYIRPLYSQQDYLNINVNTLDLNQAGHFPAGLATPLAEGDVVSFGVIGGAA
ncbi:MAG: MoaD/ThiS family protein [Desulfurispora sp.]|uniref:MoaD/ThiS family protein n=1 Tax=Desulfurispora sp. TaxID=3014275 RepID=UPI00404AC576